MGRFQVLFQDPYQVGWTGMVWMHTSHDIDILCPHDVLVYPLNQRGYKKREGEGKSY